LGAVQTASLVAAFPILIFSALAIWSFLKYLKENQPQLKQPSPEGAEIESFLVDY
jgi:choline-glycine betaine transporter